MVGNFSTIHECSPFPESIAPNPFFMHILWCFSFYSSWDLKIKGHMSCVSMLGTVVAERREVPKWSKRGTQCEDTRILWLVEGKRGQTVGGSVQGQSKSPPEVTPSSAGLAFSSCNWDPTAVVSWWP